MIQQVAKQNVELCCHQVVVLCHCTLLLGGMN